MRQLATVTPALETWGGAKTVKVMLWSHGDPVPDFGPSVGVDSETELIREDEQFPPIVVLGCYDDSAAACYIVYWRDVPEFMQGLCRADTQQRYFNLGFDEGVIDRCDPDRWLLEAMDGEPLDPHPDGLVKPLSSVRDMMIRAHLHDIAEYGYVLASHMSLEKAARAELNVALDKGDGTEDSARLSFRRENPDGTPYTITEEQARYLAMDCITTWALGEMIPEQPTEVSHTRGMAVLAHISANGLTVDRQVYNALMTALDAEMRKRAKDAVAAAPDGGFRDPFRDLKAEADAIDRRFISAYSRLTGLAEEFVTFPLTKNQLRHILAYAVGCAGSPEDVEEFVEQLRAAPLEKSLRKQVRDGYDRIVEDKTLGWVDENVTQTGLRTFLAVLLEDYADQLSGGARELDYDRASAKAMAYIDEHPEVVHTVKLEGTTTYFQRHVRELVAKNPGKLDLATTETGQLQLTKQDMWKLKDAGIKDDFLAAYTDYRHAQKYISTYMKPEYIKCDGRVHPRFTNLVRTGRTSCKNPNIQNLPSREKAYPLKNMYTARDGMLLCATDYSYIELCAFAQSCYTRFGASVMRDIINTGIDPHRWFAGIMIGKIDPDLSRKDDKDWVDWLSAKLKAEVPDAARQNAKFADFGLPGGLGEPAFFRYCRAGGGELTYDESKRIRKVWMSTFTEIEQHLQAVTRCTEDQMSKYWGPQADDDESEELIEDMFDGNFYIGRTITGMLRYKCSKNAACNLEFQGLTAEGVKLAGFELVRAGYQDRLCNFIHDEYVYQLYLSELETHIPVIQRLMIAGMKKVIPDVDVKVETTILRHWNKKGIVYEDWVAGGMRPEDIEEPKYVKGLFTA